MRLEHNLHSDRFALVTATPADPAAATFTSFDVPANSRIEIISITCTYAASAVVANRLLYFYVLAGSDAAYQTLVKGMITANETIDCHFTRGISGEDATGTHSKQYAALPANVIAVSGDKIRIYSRIIQAGDQFSDVVIRFKQWITEG